MLFSVANGICRCKEEYDPSEGQFSRISCQVLYIRKPLITGRFSTGLERERIMMGVGPEGYDVAEFENIERDHKQRNSGRL
jgi:hypothetical protein